MKESQLPACALLAASRLPAWLNEHALHILNEDQSSIPSFWHKKEGSYHQEHLYFVDREAGTSHDGHLAKQTWRPAPSRIAFLSSFWPRATSYYHKESETGCSDQIIIVAHSTITHWRSHWTLGIVDLKKFD
jgi:hypothetical protein